MSKIVKRPLTLDEYNDLVRLTRLRTEGLHAFRDLVDWRTINMNILPAKGLEHPLIVALDENQGKFAEFLLMNTNADPFALSLDGKCALDLAINGRNFLLGVSNFLLKKYTDSPDRKIPESVISDAKRKLRHFILTDSIIGVLMRLCHVAGSPYVGPFKKSAPSAKATQRPLPLDNNASAPQVKRVRRERITTTPITMSTPVPPAAAAVRDNHLQKTNILKEALAVLNNGKFGAFIENLVLERERSEQILGSIAAGQVESAELTAAENSLSKEMKVFADRTLPEFLRLKNTLATINTPMLAQSSASSSPSPSPSPSSSSSSTPTQARAFFSTQGQRIARIAGTPTAAAAFSSAGPQQPSPAVTEFRGAFVMPGQKPN